MDCIIKIRDKAELLGDGVKSIFVTGDKANSHMTVMRSVARMRIFDYDACTDAAFLFKN